jgi:hippurate hydrolase
MDLPIGIAERAHALRKELHEHPELSGCEHGTRQILARALIELGLHPIEVAGTGLYADVGTGDPVVMIRGDMDALPLHECASHPLRSTRAGVMHACGHDVHMAAAWGAMAVLAASPPQGTVRVLFQPAEETGQGARACVEAGALDSVDAVLGGHVDLAYPAGTVGIQAGPINASTDNFAIEVVGEGGHAARPHQGADALLAAAQVVVALQQIVSREVDPGEAAVVTVGKMSAGERHNVLAGRARLEGTLRSRTPQTRALLRHAIERVARGVATAHGCRARVELVAGCEVINNDPALTRIVRSGLAAALGPEQVVPLRGTNMGGEDFSELLRGRPGVYVRWGAAGPTARDAPAHSSEFRVDDATLDAAVKGFVGATRSLVAHLAVAQRVMCNG